MNRAVERETEIAMRLALGATTQHLFRQIVSENLLITLAGTVLGFTLAAASVKPLVLYGPTLPFGTLDLGLLENLHVDFSALLIGASSCCSHRSHSHSSDASVMAGREIATIFCASARGDNRFCSTRKTPGRTSDSAAYCCNAVACDHIWRSKNFLETIARLSWL